MSIWPKQHNFFEWAFMLCDHDDNDYNDKKKIIEDLCVYVPGTVKHNRNYINHYNLIATSQI